MRVLFLTDSLSLPRKYKTGVAKWEDTYVNLLKKARPDIEFIHVGLGGGTITQIFLLLNYYKLTNPDLVILHSGIVDCAPRALSQLELQLVIKLRIFRLVNPFTNFFRKHRNISYTNPKEFEETVVKIKNVFPDVPFVTIGILPGCDEYEKTVPGITKRINTYNEILRRNSTYISNEDFPRDGIIEDHHHLNEKGHKVIFDKILNLLSSDKYKD
ncbi:MAG: SGNH/GDSL hydrolase family protein [Bacteroidetes bacterium]|nr:SGNH/GDSL hydrolase family protein [Bacteroidota bacterium]